MHRDSKLKNNEIETLQNDLNYFKFNNKLMEGETGNKKEEIDSLKAKQVEIEKKEESEKKQLRIKWEFEKRYVH